MERTKEEREVIRSLIAVPRDDKPATDKELDQFLALADAADLDPLKRHCYGQLRRQGQGRVLSFVASIDGFRHVASRSGEYEGQEGPHWCGPDGVWRDVWLGAEPPAAARVGVWRKGFRAPCWAIARWEAYAQTKFNSSQPTDMWVKFSDLMLAKCAEALALRKAFPNDFGGIYTKEEMAQAEPEAAPAAPRKRDNTQQQAHEALAKEAAPALAEAGLSEEQDAPTPEEAKAIVVGAGEGASAMFAAIVSERGGTGATYTKMTGHDRAWVWSEFQGWLRKQTGTPEEGEA